MSFCSKCGQELNENENFCPNCGEVIKNEEPKKLYEGNKSIKVAKVFMIISLVFNVLAAILCVLLASNESNMDLVVEYYSDAIGYVVLFIIGLILLLKFNKKVKNNDIMSTGFKVMVLIFSNLIAGILLLTVKTDSKN